MYALASEIYQNYNLNAWAARKVSSLKNKVKGGTDTNQIGGRGGEKGKKRRALEDTAKQQMQQQLNIDGDKGLEEQRKEEREEVDLVIVAAEKEDDDNDDDDDDGEKDNYKATTINKTAFCYSLEKKQNHNSWQLTENFFVDSFIVFYI